MAARWAATLGDAPEFEAIMRTLSSSLTGTTADNYGAHWARFVKWCERQPDQPSPLPASTATVLRWLAGEVTARNTVRAGSLQPYLSALNRIHTDLDLEPPARGHLVRQYRRGLAHQQGSGGRTARRVYLPPPVVEQVLQWALRLDLRVATATARSAFRAAVATVFTFAFFARGATGSALRDSHVRRSVAGLTVTLEAEKGKAQSWDSRTITLPPGAVPGLAELLGKWESFRGRCKGRDSYYALQWERRRVFPASQIDGWLREILAHLDVQPPAGELWSGHSLRKGAASGAAALGVSLDRICWCGGWSVHSRAVHDYIDPTCPLTPACRRFFVWLRPT